MNPKFKPGDIIISNFPDYSIRQIIRYAKETGFSNRNAYEVIRLFEPYVRPYTLIILIHNIL